MSKCSNQKLYRLSFKNYYLFLGIPAQIDYHNLLSLPLAPKPIPAINLKTKIPNVLRIYQKIQKQKFNLEHVLHKIFSLWAYSMPLLITCQQ